MDLTLIFPFIILLLFIPIFLSSRKQKKAMAEMQSLQASLEAGDVVMTTSGLRATVVDASYEDTIDLEIADGVVTTWVRAAVKEKVDVVTSDPALAADDAEFTADDAATDAVDAPHEPAISLKKDDSSNGTPRT